MSWGEAVGLAEGFRIHLRPVGRRVGGHAWSVPVAGGLLTGGGTDGAGQEAGQDRDRDAALHGFLARTGDSLPAAATDRIVRGDG